MRPKTLNQNTAKNRGISVLLNAVAAAVPVEYIYRYAEIFEGAELHEMLIMVSNKQVRILNELVPVLNMVFNGQDKFSYRLFHVHEVKEALHNGSLFFDGACKPQNCLLSKSGGFLTPVEHAADNVIVQQVSAAYRDEINRAAKFLAGAKFYFKRNNRAHCAFMLHQFFDLTYRAIELLVMGKAKKTHRIQAHQVYIKSYVWPLGELFKQDEEDIYLLHLLDEAYLAVRYENTYQISEVEITQLFEKVGLLKYTAGQAYQRMMNTHFDKQVGGEV